MAPSATTPPPITSKASKTPYLDSLTRDGFVLIPSILTPDQLEALREAAQETTKLAREGKWPHVRTLPKQFPPWIIPEGENPAKNGIWGVQFLMHPSLPNSKKFIPSYFNDKVIDVIKELLTCEDEDLVLELYNMLVRPDEDFELVWHRDDIPATATAEEELDRLNKPSFHAQWNLSLYDDSSLIVIPGSHVRARTDIERNAGPHETGLPGEIQVHMKAGDVVFYNNNILHRGAYNSQKERMTLHGSMGHVGGSALRARNVLQHGIGEWVGEIDLSGLDETQRARAEGMRKRLVAMGGHTGEYSLTG
ncbi:phytanoyl-CoA dioxygenase [Tricladium varicosporioides]|nr:phytanoyl-CoA dioxygenase [Hymenoscyphus varicosporioides]